MFIQFLTRISRPFPINQKFNRIFKRVGSMKDGLLLEILNWIAQGKIKFCLNIEMYNICNLLKNLMERENQRDANESRE